MITPIFPPHYSEYDWTKQAIETKAADAWLAQTSNQGEPETCRYQPELLTKKSVTFSLIEILVEGSLIKIQVEGSSVLERDDIINDRGFQKIFQVIMGKNLSYAEFSNTYTQIAESITLIYLERGYITSKAIIQTPPKDSNEVIIKIIEGKIDKILVLGQRRLNKDYLCSRIQRGVSIPLNANRLEDRLRLLQIDPLFENIDAILQPTDITGYSNLVVTVRETNPFVGNLSFDNYSPPAVGSERYGIGLGYRNLSGIGDEIFAFYYVSTSGGEDLLDFTYRVPLNPMNGTLQVRATPDWQNITQAPFDEFHISGEKQVYDLSYRQPIIRTFREEFALSIGFNYQNGQTFVFDLPTPFGIGPNANGISRTSVFNFGQDYTRRDGSGLWIVRSQFSFGTGLFDATTNDPPIPDGHFFSWLGQIQRLQRVDDDHQLVIQLDLQLTPDSLLPAQQFIIGGQPSVRGYRQNVRSGDNGFRFSIEDRITILRDRIGDSTLQVIPFLDMGAVWNAPDNPNILPPQTFLVGAGLGLAWQPIDKLWLQFNYGYPFINLNDRGNNLQDNGIYFEMNYRF